MVVDFDPDKSARNEAERGLPFYRVEDFDWPNVIIGVDDRKDYGEQRMILLGPLDGRIHIAIVTPRESDIRVISLRRANRKEVRYYEQEVGRSSRTP